MAHDVRRTAIAIDQTASARALPQEAGAVLTAIVDDISPEGIARVVVHGESRPRTAATTLHFASAAAAAEALLGQTVLVVVPAAGSAVIIGLVRDHLWPQRGDGEMSTLHATLPSGQARQLVADKRLVNLEASDEIRLTCGKSLLVLRRDGTVIVRGVKITSRASGTHRIMGATVGIN